MSIDIIEPVGMLMREVEAYADAGEDLYDILESEWFERRCQKIADQQRNFTRAGIDAMVNEYLRIAMWH